MDNTVFVTVSITSEGRKRNVAITFPSQQEKMSVRETSHILASGISLMIKTCSINDTGIKDYQLIEEVIEHLRMEFSSIESFNDAKHYSENFKKHQQ